MEGKMTFCEECRSDVAYTIKSEMLAGVLKGEEYPYEGKTAVCAVCGREVYVPEIEDENLEALYCAYRIKNGIIPLEQILEIPKKYAIGKRPLSRLLGWGEMTFTRYCDGDMPTKQYSDTLKRLYDDPVCYLEMLELNKGNLKSLQTYKRSERKTKELIGAKMAGRTKIDSVIGYLLWRCEDITPLALQKVLYYVQGFYYAFTQEFLFEEDCEAWVHGPVYREIYGRYAGYRFDAIEPVEEFDSSVFTVMEKAVIDNVIRYFCCYSGKVLENFTHMEAPWMETRDDLPSEAPSNQIIQKDRIGHYFSDVKLKYDMLVPGDMESYASTMFERVK